MTFGGDRVVQFASGEKESLNDLIQAMWGASTRAFRSPSAGTNLDGMSLNRRVCALDILNELTKHLNETSKKIQEANCLTWFFNRIREWCSSTAKFHTYLDTGNIAEGFRSFTRKDANLHFEDHPSVNFQRSSLAKGDRAIDAIASFKVSTSEDVLREIVTPEQEIEERLCDLERRSENLFQSQENRAQEDFLNDAAMASIVSSAYTISSSENFPFFSMSLDLPPFFHMNITDIM